MKCRQRQRRTELDEGRHDESDDERPLGGVEQRVADVARVEVDVCVGISNCRRLVVDAVLDLVDLVCAVGTELVAIAVQGDDEPNADGSRKGDHDIEHSRVDRNHGTRADDRADETVEPVIREQ